MEPAVQGEEIYPPAVKEEDSAKIPTAGSRLSVAFRVHKIKTVDTKIQLSDIGDKKWVCIVKDIHGGEAVGDRLFYIHNVGKLIENNIILKEGTVIS